MAARRISGELLKGHLPTLVLSVITSEPAHGYAIMQRLALRSEGALKLAQGTIYPLLYSLEEQGLIASRPETVNGRIRRVYAVTEKGARRLQQGREEWRTFESAVNAVLATS